MCESYLVRFNGFILFAIYMKIKYISSIILLFCFFTDIGCNPIEEITQNTNDIYLAGYNKVALQSEITTVQPMSGIVFWPAQAKSRNSTYGSSISLEFSYCLPRMWLQEKRMVKYSMIGLRLKHCLMILPVGDIRLLYDSATNRC